MKTFLAIYLGKPEAMEAWNKLPEPVRREREATGMRQWQAWVERHQSAIVDMGGPLGKTKEASPAGLKNVRNAMTAYVIVRAESHDQAVRMFEGHPHFTAFPGSSVEVMECLPIPTAP